MSESNRAAPREQEAAGRWRRVRHRLAHLLTHDHDDRDAAGQLIDSGAVAIRATKVSLIALGVTAAIQALIVVFSGSVALLSDTLHNLTDALTAIPLWIAFAVGRRAPTRRYTYGFNRIEDAAGFLIVMAIAASAVLVIWESVQRLIEPRLIDHIPWVIAAGLVGALGNELVARYRMTIGERVGSEALITDGRHARTDALTSLAVVVAGVGAAFGAAWVDPAVGLVVAGAILVLFARSARRMTRRVLDGIDPEIVDEVAGVAQRVDGVREITELRVRWHGHQLRVDASIAVDPDLTVAKGHDVAHHVEHHLIHHFSVPVTALIHVSPYGMPEAHDATAHHER